MNCFYVLVITMAFIPATAPTCTSEKTYPPAMLWLNVSFLINSSFFFYMYHNGFFVDWFKESKKEDVSAEEKIDVDETTQTKRTIFREQMKAYNCYACILSVV